MNSPRRMNGNDRRRREVIHFSGVCDRGGIGRRASLRSWWGNPWGFESLRSHWPLTRQVLEGGEGRWRLWRTDPFRSSTNLHHPPQPPIPTPIRFGSPMPDILVKKTRAEPGEASLEVTIPRDNVKAAEERATKAYQQRARLPGFRQGKAPAAVVRKKFADDIRQET